MRFFLVITLLLNSLPVITSARTATPRSNPGAFRAIPDDGPTPAPTPTPDPVLEQAKREAAIADELKKKAVADKDRAQAEIDKLKNQALPFGTPSNVQIPTGNVQTDAAGWVESQMLAHEAAREISKRLVARLCNDGAAFRVGGVAEPLMTTEANDQRILRDLEDDESESPAPSSSPEPSPSSTINTLVIYHDDDLSGVELYNTVRGQLLELGKEFKNENRKARGFLNITNPSSPLPKVDASVSAVGASSLLAAPGIATGVIKSVAELLNLFRTETRFENKSVQISEDMVVSHLVNNLVDDGRCPAAIKVYYPALFPPKLVESSSSSMLVKVLNRVERLKEGSSLLVERIDARVKELNDFAAKMEDLEKKKNANAQNDKELNKKLEEQKTCGKSKSAKCQKIAKENEELNSKKAEFVKAIQALEKQLEKIKNENVKTPDDIKSWVVKLEEQKSRLQPLINSTDLLSSKLNTPDANTKLTALAQLLRAEKLHYILRDAQTFTLRVAVTANGTTKIKKNLFVDAKVRHSAGANLVYQLFNRNGALAQGDVMQCYIDYRSAKDVYEIVRAPGSVNCLTQSASTGNNKPKSRSADGGK